MKNTKKLYVQKKAEEKKELERKTMLQNTSSFCIIILFKRTNSCKNKEIEILKKKHFSKHWMELFCLSKLCIYISLKDLIKEEFIISV